MGVYFREGKHDVLSEHGKKIQAKKFNSSFGDQHRFYVRTRTTNIKLFFSAITRDLLSKIYSIIFASNIDFENISIGDVIEFSGSKLNKHSQKEGKIAYKDESKSSFTLSIVVEGARTVSYTTLEFAKRFFSKKTKMIYREIQVNETALEKYSPNGRAEIMLWRSNVNKRWNILEERIIKILEDYVAH